MDTILINPKFHSSLERLAEQEARAVSDLVNEIIEQYLQDEHEYQLDLEIEAYHQLHPELKEKYLGEWVAIHNRKLVDHDADAADLHRRIRARFGRETVLIRQVEQAPERVLWWRSPQIERGAK